MKMLIFWLREIKDWVEFFFGLIPGKTGLVIRRTYYQYRIGSCQEGNRFETGFKVEFPKNIKFGSNCFLGLDCKVYASEFSKVLVGSNITVNSNVMINARGKGKISIGDNVLIGPNVVIRSNNHSFSKTIEPIKTQGMDSGEIVIQNNVWIGSNCVILPNCTIGEGSIVAAGAVVTSSVESYSIVGGVPAKEIQKRDYKIKE